MFRENARDGSFGVTLDLWWPPRTFQFKPVSWNSWRHCYSEVMRSCLLRERKIILQHLSPYLCRICGFFVTNLGFNETIDILRCFTMLFTWCMRHIGIVYLISLLVGLFPDSVIICVQGLYKRSTCDATVTQQKRMDDGGGWRERRRIFFVFSFRVLFVFHKLQVFLYFKYVTPQRQPLRLLPIFVGRGKRLSDFHTASFLCSFVLLKMK